MGSRRISARDVLHEIREQEALFLDLKFVDLFGKLQHLTLPHHAVDEDTLHHGLGFDGSSVRGFQAIDESDMILKPDPSSLFMDPFFDETTLSVFCDIIDPVGYKPYTRDPRGVAKRAERLVRSLGLADTSYFGPELEFFLFDDVRFDTTSQHSYFHLDAETAFWNQGRAGDAPNTRHRSQRKGAYFAAPPTDGYHNLRSKMSLVLEQVGITPELHHAEVAAAGQNEIGFRFGELTEQADQALKFKYVVKNTAARYGKIATFMPKPLFEENGSGMHVHVSLWRGGENLFYQHDRYGDLSDMAVHFIGGLLQHASALCGLVAPSTNSYRRLVPGYEAPINLAYSCRNRSACVRIPMTGTNSKAKRVEFRTPDCSANPYLAYAAILLAGVDGILNETKPPDPIDEDIYELVGTEKGKSIGSAPGSLEKAIDALEADHDFLLRGDVFTRDLVDLWIESKRTNEIDYINLRPHPGEFGLYFDC